MNATGRFSRSDRLLDSRDFRRVSRAGRRVASRYFVLLLAGSRAPHDESNEHCERVRLGITVSRKVGNAVVRNYIKRNVREWFRRSRSPRGPLDLVVIARRDAAGLSGSEIPGELESLVARAEMGRDS